MSAIIKMALIAFLFVLFVASHKLISLAVVKDPRVHTNLGHIYIKQRRRHAPSGTL